MIKAAEWNPEFGSKYRNNSAIGRPKRWEDDINEFLKFVDERQNLTESSDQMNKTWINSAKDRRRWALLEENFTMTSEERHENNARTRNNSHNRPARYVNGVRLSEEEVANITSQCEKKILKQAKIKIFESRSSFAFSSACCTPKRIWKSAAARNQERVDGWIHEQLDG